MEKIFSQPILSKDIESVSGFLVATGRSIAVAESVTAGFIQAAFSSAKNATCFFQGGITVYNLGQKSMQLQVDPIHAASCNCVSQKVADQMALGIMQKFSADYGIGITGYAAPIPEKNIDQLFAFVAVGYKNKIIAYKKINAPSIDPQAVQQFYTNEIFSLLSSILKNNI